MPDGFGCAVSASAPALSVSPDMISVRRLLRAMPVALSPIVSTSAAPRTISGTPSSMRTCGKPVVASITGSPTSSSSYELSRPVPEVVARRSSLAGSVWQLMQVLAPATPRERVHSGWMWSG